MTFRIVAIPLLAAICLETPALASSAGREEQRRRDRGGDNNRGGDNRGGGNRGGDNRRYGRSAPQVRVAVPARPVVNVNVGYRGPRYYAPSYWPVGAASLWLESDPLCSLGVDLGIGRVCQLQCIRCVWCLWVWRLWCTMRASRTLRTLRTLRTVCTAYAPYAPYVGYDFGGIRLRIRPRDAQVFVDGNYAGLVDDFDGTFQQLRLEQGGHKIEIRMPGFEDLELDVHVQPGRTITLQEDLRPRP